MAKVWLMCYLGEMLCCGGGCGSAIAARCCVFWGKFRKHLPVATSRHLSHKMRGKMYEACVRSAMLHGSENWGPKEPELRRLHRSDLAMIRRICGINDRDETPQLHYYRSVELRISYRSFAVGESDGMAMYKGPLPVSNISRTVIFPALERKESPGRHGLNVWKLMSMSLA